MASLDGASTEIIVRGAEALALLLGHVPPGAHPQNANMIGAYVHTAADALTCAQAPARRARPAPETAAMCRDTAGQAPTVGAFNLVAPKGDWIANEGMPADIPLLGGARVLVLDPPPYERRWPASRYFPFVPADLVLERPLTTEEAAQWFAHVRPAHSPTAGVHENHRRTTDLSAGSAAPRAASPPTVPRCPCAARSRR